MREICLINNYFFLVGRYLVFVTDFCDSVVLHRTNLCNHSDVFVTVFFLNKKTN